MSLSVAQLKALSFGYLCGADLAAFCPPLLLIKVWEVDQGPNTLIQGCGLAKEEILASLRTKYDLTTEIEKMAFTPAQAIAVLTLGVVSGITLLTGGTNYGDVPTVSFAGNTGSGAAAIAILTGTAVSGFTISNGGSNYVQPPSVNVVGGAAADTRLQLLVKIMSILSVRNVLGSAQNISDFMQGLFKWASETLRDMRNGQQNLLANQAEPCLVSSPGKLVCDTFSTLG